MKAAFLAIGFVLGWIALYALILWKAIRNQGPPEEW